MAAPEKPKAAILLIDDEQIVHDSVRRILESEGYKVDGAFRVAEAIEKLASRSYDLVLTDLMMPDQSGMKAVEAVARDHPHCGVVMFTGFATVESAVESMKLGALDYLPKPFTPEELIDVTQKALAKTYKARRDREIEETYAQAEKAIASSLDLKEVLGLISLSVVRLLKVKGCCLYTYSKKQGRLELAASKGLSDEYLAKGTLDPMMSLPEAMKAEGPIRIEDSEFDTKLQYPQEARKEGIVAMMTVPLKVHDTVVGLLRIYVAEKRSFNKDEMDILLKFADHGAQAIENAMAYDRLRGDIEQLKKDVPQAFKQNKG
ncbi:MAG: response regulator [Thermodesulfobacteriota bacterium]